MLVCRRISPRWKLWNETWIIAKMITTKKMREVPQVLLVFQGSNAYDRAQQAFHEMLWNKKEPWQLAEQYV